ncbi:MAG: aspartate aminotransferase family protein [Thermoleophilia bacterium]
MSQDVIRDQSVSDGLYERALRVIPAGVSTDYRHGTTPTYWASASGSRMRDVDGNEYIDYLLGLGPHILGHAPEAVVRAVAASLPDGQLFAGQHPRELELAELICRLIPSAERVRYLMTGTEAVALALRLARAATGRSLIVKFEGHYHGWQDGIFVGSHPGYYGRGYPAQDAKWPESGGQLPGAYEHVVLLPWNDAAALEAFLSDHPTEVAGIIMEPVMCNSAVIEPEEGYLAAVRDACDRYGCLLIFDEIITGFRIALTGAQGHYDVKPDVTTFGKALGGGFPISCVVGRREVMDLLGDPRVTREQPLPMHGGTFNSNVTAVVASLAALEILQHDDTYAYLDRLGTALMRGMDQILSEAGVPHVVQGFPTAFYVDFNDFAPRSLRDIVNHDHRSYHEFVRKLKARGVLTHPRGVWYLSTAHTEDDVQATLAACRACLP